MADERVAGRAGDGRIVIAFPFAPDAQGALRAAAAPGFRVEVLETVDQATVDAATGGGCVALISQLRPSDAAAAPDLRWQQVLSAGVEHLLRAGAWPGHVQLTNAKGVYAASIAQYVLAAILRVAEHMDRRRDLQLARTWPDLLDDLTGRPVRGMTLLVVGYGGIGREVARVGRALGMRVLAVTARPERLIDDSFRMPGTGDPDGSIPERILGLDGLHAALAEADFVSLNAPLTPATRGLIAQPELEAMRPGAWLINTGRGAVIATADLVEALRAGHIGGAVLDVTDPEPLPADSPLWDLPNAVITPHVSGADSPDAVSALVAENIGRFCRGEPLLNLVDLARGY